MPRQTPPSIQAETILRSLYPTLTYGRYNCRPISGSTTWSQHSWNNALDIWGPVSLLDEVNQFLRDNLEAFNIRVRLWRVRNHFAHIHVDFWPKGFRIPGCSTGLASRYQYPDGNIRINTTLINTYEETMAFTEEQEKVLKEIVAAVVGEESSGYFAKYAIQLIREARTKRLHNHTGEVTAESAHARLDKLKEI